MAASLLTKEVLAEAGYKPFVSLGREGMQKCVRVPGGVTNYFIDCYIVQRDGVVTIAAEGHFYLGKWRDGPWFTVEVHSAQKLTVEELEGFFSDVYVKLDCCPDVHDND
jgi:hypothetical protein